MLHKTMRPLARFGNKTEFVARSSRNYGLAPQTKYPKISRTEGVKGFPNVNARYIPDEHDLGVYTPDLRAPKGPSDAHWNDTWNDEELQSAVEDHVMLSWSPSDPAKGLPKITRASGVYLYDSKGKQYLDWTSQAICCNYGHDVPEPVQQAIHKQLQDVPYIYGGMGMVPVRARLAQLMSDLLPGDINGFLFPCGGAEANEAAIRIARAYTGRQKIFTQYRSYHGGTANTLGATGDFRRWFTESTVSGFVKIFNPQPLGFSMGGTDEEAAQFALSVLEEQVLLEGPGNIAAVMLESIVGAGGVLVPPVGYVEGVRALCDKYGMLLILDEVMAGFGRTGKLWAFDHFNGVIPDIVTSAKGLTGAFLPLSMVGMREPIRQYFQKNPLGWGATYHAHPVAMACAYECVKYTVKEQLPERAKALQSVMVEEIQNLKRRHRSVKQGRAIGLFGCIDLQKGNGKLIQKIGEPMSPEALAFKQALQDNGIMGLFRPPLLHCAPPLVITEEELRDGFQRVSKALDVLDKLV